MICGPCTTGDHARCTDREHKRDYADCFCGHRDRNAGWVDSSEQKPVGE